ncbi:MAG: ASCH domain-containing protein [Cyanobacteria bacterium SBLK]|nr:ASCH domain-containing protein [Cyanobacteria bacterium SBLK]
MENQKIKALSLWQPWASLITHGHKQYETRSWFTDYRGTLLIHAAKRTGEQIQKDTAFILQNKHNIRLDWGDLPLGQLVCICDLVDCIPITGDVRRRLSQQEKVCGDWSSGRWAWDLRNVRAIDPLIPLRGRQGLFNVDSSLLINHNILR